MPSPGLFTPWQEMETLDSAGTAARPLVQNSIAPAVCSVTARGTSLLRIRAMSAFGKSWPPPGLFTPWQEMETLASVGTAVRPQTLNLSPPAACSSTSLETSSLRTLAMPVSGRWSRPRGLFKPWQGMGRMAEAGMGPATSAQLNGPFDVAADGSGNVFIADSGNQRIREVVASTGTIQTVAGNGAQGFSGDGGPATSASLRNPRPLCRRF